MEATNAATAPCTLLLKVASEGTPRARWSTPARLEVPIGGRGLFWCCGKGDSVRAAIGDEGDPTDAARDRLFFCLEAEEGEGIEIQTKLCQRAGSPSLQPTPCLRYQSSLVAFSLAVVVSLDFDLSCARTHYLMMYVCSSFTYSCVIFFVRDRQFEEENAKCWCVDRVWPFLCFGSFCLQGDTPLFSLYFL